MQTMSYVLVRCSDGTEGQNLVSEASLFNWLMFHIIKSTHVYSLAVESIDVTGPNVKLVFDCDRQASAL